MFVADLSTVKANAAAEHRSKQSQSISDCGQQLCYFGGTFTQLGGVCPVNAAARFFAAVIAIARRVLNRELTTDPEVILGLVKAAGAKRIRVLRVQFELGSMTT